MSENPTAVLQPARWWHIPTMVAIDDALFGTDAWSVASFWAELAGIPQRRWYRVLLEGEAVVGYGGLAVVGQSADVQTVAVRADRQGRGLGGVLLDALLGEADRRGCTEVLLEVRADNDAAIGLYAVRGFATIATRRRYYADGTDAVILRRGS
ncbi:MAG TPA: ribosomal protein S18-alanine N-acetyltransferase [Sporichthyaceae bacterium]|nr:ribosomal protein S18-alanine N-acetyltransferase [Sporichthyaceae bacterium]